MSVKNMHSSVFDNNDNTRNFIYLKKQPTFDVRNQKKKSLKTLVNEATN